MADKWLIDANALLDFISDERKEATDNKNHEKMRGNDYEMHFWSGALAQARWIRQHIKETPTIDAVEVVRCKDCMFSKKYMTGNLYCELHNSYVFGVHPDGFCYRGVKVDGGEPDGNPH